MSIFPITNDAPTRHTVLNVLLVVPDSSVAIDVELLLEGRPYRLHAVTGGTEDARKAIHELDPDIVLAHLDNVGVGSGSLMAWARRIGSTAPVLVIAPPRQEARAVQAVNDGAMACLSLPVSPIALSMALERAIELRGLVLSARKREAGLRRHLQRRQAAGDRYKDALDQLYMAWQPLFHSDGNQLFGYEALVRSDAPDCPSAWHVLDLASRLGRQSQLDQYIGMHSAADLALGGLEGTAMINVTLRQLTSGQLGSRTDPLLPHADRVILEVSEDGRIDDIDALANIVGRLKARGYRFAVDDLGTGCDYLARLLALQPEIFKLDRLALANCDKDDRKRRYVRAIVAMAHNEGAMVVAEGIERESEAEVARDLGCDLLQGYLLGRPSRRAYWVHGDEASPAANTVNTQDRSWDAA